MAEPPKPKTKNEILRVALLVILSLTLAKLPILYTLFITNIYYFILDLAMFIILMVFLFLLSRLIASLHIIIETYRETIINQNKILGGTEEAILKVLKQVEEQA